MVDYLSEIQNFLKENGITKNINLKTDFRKLGMDSLAIMDMIIKMEEKFNFTLPDDRLLEIKNVEDFINLLKELK